MKNFKFTGHSQSRQDSDDSLADSVDSHPPSISRIFSDAALYDDLLVQQGCIERCKSKLTEGDFQVASGFANLVGRDLTPSEKAIAGRLSKLSVTGDHWTTEELTEEPESYADSETSSDPEPLTASSTTSTASSRSSDGSYTAWKPEPEELVQLFVDEFGGLAVEDEKEEMIFETDVALFVDVVVVGVVHVTTHRLTFHASLLSTRPDLLPSQQVIKAGPAIIHCSGMCRKRRVWLELSHDMVCSYSSGSEEDRIRPFRTILLSSIKKLRHRDPKKPRFLSLVFEKNSEDVDGIVEFTTEEAAIEWAREFQGALFLFRHRRRQALRGNDAETSTGIRLSIPLHRIDEVQFQSTCFNTMPVASLKVRLSPNDNNDFSDGGGEDTYMLRFFQMLPSPQWSQLGDFVEAAKSRKNANGSESETSSTIIDFSPSTFLEDNVKHSDVRRDTEKAVRNALALEDESDLWVTKARIRRGFYSSGQFIVTRYVVGFWSKSLTQSDVRYRIPTNTIKRALASSSKRWCGSSRMTLQIEGHTDLKFEFKTQDLRDEAVRHVNAALKNDDSSSTLVSSEPSSADSSSFHTRSSQQPLSAVELISPISRTVAAVVSRTVPVGIRLPKAINLPGDILFKRPSLHFVCLTIGSRGDVQPYIALGLGLKNEGHRVTIVTHEEYKDWIVGFGLGHRQAGGDPGALMKLSVENKMFSPEFFRESLSNFRPWLDSLLEDAWTACKDADVLLESPSAMAGVHISEALKIPYFRTFTMPWTKTKQFPHTFLSPPVEAPTFNSLSYVLFDNVLWTATSGQINKWRRNSLQLEPTDMGHLAQSKITFVYNFSQAVVPKPLDWGDSIAVSGYWFLDNPELGWTPPESLLDWMAKARQDQKPIVYIGFGSITVPNPNRLTKHIVKAVLKSGVRAILCKGWSGRMSKEQEPEIEIPPECYSIDKIPHDWLFPQIDAALHHGGAGTTGASLRAGIPTLIRPWFGDQYFWASRVQKLGAGLRIPSLRSSDLAEALTRATSSRIMKEKAASIGEKIRSEDGVKTAIKYIYTYLPRAARDRSTLD